MYAKTWVYRRYRNVVDPDTGRRGKVLISKNWYVGWYDTDGRRRCESCGPNKKAAERRQRELEGQMAAGVYEAVRSARWKDLRDEYEEMVLASKSEATQAAERGTMKAFEAICKPKKVARISSRTIDNFVAGRKAGKPYGHTVSAATINHDLRNLRVVLRTAHRWKYLAEVPSFVFLAEPRRTPRTLSDADFDSLVKAADAWWRPFLQMARYTGLRKSELLGLRWEHIDLANGTIFLPADLNKAQRDETIPLHPDLVPVLLKIRTEDPVVFRWVYNARTFYTAWHRLQDDAGIVETRHHKFHDLRRTFVSDLARRGVNSLVVQRLARHQSLQTTQRHYSNVEPALKEALSRLKVVRSAQDGPQTA